MHNNSTIEVFGQVYAGDSPRDAEGAWLAANKRISYESELVFSVGSGDRSGPVSIEFFHGYLRRFVVCADGELDQT
jgi:hypothetical protein